MAEKRRVVVGIDGGGSKTHALLVGFDGTVIAEKTAGGSNLQTIGIQKAAQVFLDLIEECAKKSETDPSLIVHVVIGAAGAGRPATRSELIATISSLGTKNKFPLSQITVDTDARIALEAAFPGKPVLVLIAGTGSIALYRSDDLQIHRVGGWGSMIGDEGSGYALARDACAAVMRQHDGRAEKTILTQKILSHFEISEIEDLIPRLYLDHHELFPFAEKVIEAAVERDRVARQILIKNAAELVEHVRILTLLYPPKHILPVCMMGGLLQNENEYSKLVREKLIGTLPHIVIQKPKFPAAFGAAIIGLNAFR